MRLRCELMRGKENHFKDDGWLSGNYSFNDNYDNSFVFFAP